jgi:hypothetical protein
MLVHQILTPIILVKRMYVTNVLIIVKDVFHLLRVLNVFSPIFCNLMAFK